MGADSGTFDPDVELVRRSELFDADWYVAQYPDVALVPIDAAKHYVWLGGRLGRNPSPRFDAAAYLERNPDVRTFGLNPLVHYLRAATPTAPTPAAETCKAEPEGPTPHYGAAFDALVRAAQGRCKSAEQANEEYRVIQAAFDVAYYLARYPDIARAKRIDPVQHYIDNGAKEGRDPTPDFSTKHYLQRYPDVAESGLNPFYHWLVAGRAEGRIAAPFKHFAEACALLERSPAEVQDMLVARRRSLQQRLKHGVLGEMVAKAAEIEPLIAHSWMEAFAAKLPPFHSDAVVTHMTATQRLHAAANFRRAKAAVVIPHVRMSGATRIAGYLTDALAGLYGAEDVVVVRTDLSAFQHPEWFPERCRQIDFFGLTSMLDPFTRAKTLAEYLRALRADIVVSVNSALFWEAMRIHGKAMSATIALYAYFFCNDKNRLGHWTGYPLSQFYRHFDTLAGVITDSHALAEEILVRHHVPQHQTRKVTTLRTPIAETPPLAAAPPRDPERRAQVFWAGRFDRQKRLDLVFAIARGMPDVDFHVWGEPVLDQDAPSDAPANVSLQGRYRHIDELPLHDCDAWLYTSEWDGVPNMLIEVAARGIPLVGSLAGGTGEVLLKGLSWPIADIEDIEAYKAAIRTILQAPEEARAMARQLRQQMLAQRTPKAYAECLASFLADTGSPAEAPA